MKVVLINTPKGQYTIPLIKVAEDRAEYYSDKDDFEVDSMEWNEEIDIVMKDNYIGIDWLLNNSDWEDWEEVSTEINHDIYANDDDFWTSTDDFKIINL